MTIAADCCPRMSPPAFWPASSADSRRSARSPCAVVFARLGDALLPGMRGGLAARVDHGDLAHIPAWVLLQQVCERLLRTLPAPHHREAPRTVRHLDERLRCDRTHAGFGPGHDGPDREVVRLDRHAEIPRGRIARDDGECVRQRPRPGMRLERGQDQGEQKHGEQGPPMSTHPDPPSSGVENGHGSHDPIAR